jgi:hypothetical protein
MPAATPPVERRLAGVEVLADVGQGDVGDGEVEVCHGGDQDQRAKDEAGALGAARLHLAGEPIRMTAVTLAVGFY